MKIHVLVLALLFATSIQAASVEKSGVASFGEFVAHNSFFQSSTPVFEVVELSDVQLSKTLKEFPIRMIAKRGPPRLELHSRVTSIKLPTKLTVTQDISNSQAKAALEFVQQVVLNDQMKHTKFAESVQYVNSISNVLDEPLIVYGRSPNTWVKLKRLD